MLTKQAKREPQIDSSFDSDQDLEEVRRKYKERKVGSEYAIQD